MAQAPSPQEQQQSRIVNACSAWQVRSDDDRIIRDAFCTNPTARPEEHQAYCMVRDTRRIDDLNASLYSNCALEPIEAERACVMQRDMDQRQMNALRTFQDLAGTCPSGSKAGGSAALGAMSKVYGSHDEQGRVSTGCTLM